ncbi:MAG: c-type cytochrome [Gammaproteobacteria bacterium]
MRRVLQTLGAVIFAASSVFVSEGFAADERIERGNYLLQIAGCVTCHSAEGGAPLAGGHAFKTAFGTFYSPNITADAEHGIGAWSEAQFVRALKYGRAPDGRAYAPVFPYTSYQAITDEDAKAMFAALQAKPAVAQANRAHETVWWLADWMFAPWQWLFMPEASDWQAQPSDELQRGRYLVDVLGHCGECHTSRQPWGAVRAERALAGAAEGPDGKSVPNITPHREHGIGKWRARDLAWFLQTGEYPDGDYVGGAMTPVVDHATSKLTPQDRQAMVADLLARTPLADE